MIKKARIIDVNPDVETGAELIDYLFYQYDHDKSAFGKYFDVDQEANPGYFGENFLCGYFREMYFEICFTPKRFLSLTTSGADMPEEKKLINYLSPVMWDVDENSKAPKVKIGQEEAIYTAPIFETYDETEGTHEIVWDTYDPEARLKDLIFGAKILDMQRGEMKILHPNYTPTKIKNSILVGEYPAGISEEVIENLKTCSEMELYLYLSDIKTDIAAIHVKRAKSDDDMRTLITSNFKLQYLYQQVGKRFNVKVNKPNSKFVKPTPEILAWEKWWKEGIANEYDDFITARNNSVFYATKGIDFRPKGSYQELVPAFEEVVKDLYGEDEKQ